MQPRSIGERAFAALLILGFSVTPVSLQPVRREEARSILAVVDIPMPVWAGETILPPGQYRLWPAPDAPRVGEGQAPCGSCWMELLQGDVVRGREQATIVDEDLAARFFKGPRPPTDGARVDLVGDGAYLRIWINRDGTDYVLSLFAAPPPGR